jgi:hypothetical protein
MARKLEVELNAKSNADVIFGRAQRAASKFAGEIGQRIMGAVAPMVLFDKGMSIITGSIDKYADANARARKLGVPFSEFFQLSEALEDAGISEETTAKAMKEMAIVLAEAQGGAENQTKALKDLGFTQEQISGGAIKVVDLFMRLADATKAARSEAERNNVVLTILGKKTGPELANALSAGSTELRKNMGSAANATDDLGERSERLRIFWNNFKDDMAAGGMWGVQQLQDLVTAPARAKAMKQAFETISQGRLDDATSAEVLARALIEVGKVQDKSVKQMRSEIEAGGDLNKYLLESANSWLKTRGTAEDQARVIQMTIDKTKELLDAKLKINAAESKPQFQQFGATTMQALGGGYANARAGGPMNQPIGALSGTTPMMPGTPTNKTPQDQIFQDIYSIVKTIGDKIKTPSTNETRDSFRLPSAF